MYLVLRYRIFPFSKIQLAGSQKITSLSIIPNCRLERKNLIESLCPIDLQVYSIQGFV